MHIIQIVREGNPSVKLIPIESPKVSGEILKDRRHFSHTFATSNNTLTSDSNNFIKN